MFLIIIKALYFFLPSYVANAVPVFISKYDLMKFLDVRLDFGKRLNGEDLIGRTKSYRGVVGGIIAGVCFAVLQFFLSFIEGLRFLYIFPYSFVDALVIGFLLSFGEGVGDALKSFFKRRFKVKSSKPVFLLDQSSFLCGLLLVLFYVQIDFVYILVILIFSPLIPIIANVVAYKLHLKDVWW